MLRHYLRHYDYPLLFLSLALMLFGLVMVYSAQPDDPNSSYLSRQVMNGAIGLGAMAVVTALDYRFLGAWSKALYVGIVGVMGLVFVIGSTSFGAQRWFQIVDRQIQPSELAKLLLIIVLAKYLGDRAGQHRAYLISGLLAAVPMVLILLQPNLSTAIIVGVIWLTMAIIAGMPLRWLFAALLLLAVAVPLAWPHVPEYQRDRVLIFMDPSQDPSGQGYNLIQSRIAIGGGGLMGQGYRQGSQNQLGYLRVRHTDFIFSIIGERRLRMS